jgi:hypothetical protein
LIVNGSSLLLFHALKSGRGRVPPCDLLMRLMD